MRVLHYVDDNVLSWGKPYIQLLSALRGLGCENIAVCRPGGPLSGLLEGAGVEMSDAKTASPLRADRLTTFEETAQRTEDFYRKILEAGK